MIFWPIIVAREVPADVAAAVAVDVVALRLVSAGRSSPHADSPPTVSAAAVIADTRLSTEAAISPQACQTGARTSPRRPPIVTDTAPVRDRNVLGEELEPCGTDPMTGFYRDGCCSTGPEDLGSHTICAVVTAEFLDHQRAIGNDLSTPMPHYHFPGLVPGDRWCVTAMNWLRAHEDGAAAYVVLASTHERALEIVPLTVLREHAVDVPADPGSLGE
jgi:uncharacterized protein (DUF2237 family)